MKETTEPIDINQLEYLAWKYSETDITKQEIRQKNITELVWHAWKQAIERGDILVIQIIGRVIKGKSTVECQIVEKIREWQKQTTDSNAICPDQYFFSRKITENIHDTCLGIDEFSRLATGGFNSTMDEKWLEEFSDLHAQRHISRVSCSPKQISDKNCEYILQVVDKDTNKKITRCQVWYNLTNPINETIQLIGYMDFDVSETINKPWYKDYRKRKEARWNLLLEKGRMNIRDLYFSEVILEAYKQTEIFAKRTKVTRNLLGGEIKLALEKQKQPISILARDYLIGETQQLTDYRHELIKLVKEYNNATFNSPKEKEEFKKEQITPMAEKLEQLTGKHKENAAILKEYLGI